MQRAVSVESSPGSAGVRFQIESFSRSENALQASREEDPSAEEFHCPAQEEYVHQVAGGGWDYSPCDGHLHHRGSATNEPGGARRKLSFGAMACSTPLGGGQHTAGGSCPLEPPSSGPADTPPNSPDIEYFRSMEEGEQAEGLPVLNFSDNSKVDLEESVLLNKSFIEMPSSPNSSLLASREPCGVGVGGCPFDGRCGDLGGGAGGDDGASNGLRAADNSGTDPVGGADDGGDASGTSAKTTGRGACPVGDLPSPIPHTHTYCCLGYSMEVDSDRCLESVASGLPLLQEEQQESESRGACGHRSLGAETGPVDISVDTSALQGCTTSAVHQTVASIESLQ